jgi:hypothetical protein
MSQGIFSTVANYGGKNPNANQHVKQFIVSDEDVVPWTYTRYSNSSNYVITPANTTNNVYITTDLIVGGSFSNPSDKKLKTNIDYLDDNRSNNILNLNPIKYNYNYDKEKRSHFGFTAQEVEEYYPELINNNFYYEDNTYKTINYIELIPIMLSKMKKMQNEIDELKKSAKI